MNKKINCPIFPIQNQVLYNYYEKAVGCFWTTKEVDFSNDKYDWDNKLNSDETLFLSNILSFFAQADLIVNINLEKRFLEDIETLPSDMYKYVELFYNFQKSIEDIHNQTYEFMLHTYITDNTKLNFLKNGIDNIPSIQKKAQWAYKWIDDDESNFATRLIAFASLEGIFFSGSFCSIYWIKEKNILNGLTKSNEFISRDEGLHRDFACELFNQLKERNEFIIDDDIIINIIKEAVEIEKEFIIEALPCRLIGMNSILMSQYIEFIADNLLQTINMKKLYNVENPFNFMENISLNTKTNFFESRETNYSKANTNVKLENKSFEFILDDEF